jgi:aminopeptidase YwaD
MDRDKVLLENTEYILRQVRHVIETFGPRPPGGPGETAAQAYAAEELRTFTDDVIDETFEVHPKAFMGFAPVTAVLLLISTGMYWLWPWAALPLTAAALCIAIAELILYRQLLDPLFPKCESHNVTGVIRPTGEVKRRIILSGHMDAAYEWRYSQYSRGLLKAIILLSFSGIFFKTAVDAAAVFSGHDWSGGYANIWGALGLIQMVFAPVFASLLFFSNFSRTVPGANDNLSGLFVAMAAAKSLREMDRNFEHTEINVVNMGSEEAGLRGAKAYAMRHQAELEKVETVFIALETLRELPHLAVYNRDLNGLVKHHEGAAELLRQAGERLGRKLPFASIFLGASDAAAFSQAGIPAVALAAMDPAPARYYHTRSDDWENMDPECLRIALEITLEAVELFDAHGLAKAGA